MQPSVRILMATYNGEKFIKEQINSIINQTYTNWSLIIQDDGSKDRTAEIIKGFDDPRINIRESPEKMHGAYYNFHSIANQEKLSDMRYDYYMFCDQDDIWDSDKIEKMFLFLSKEDNNEPVFCYADMRIIDEKGKKQSSSICKSQGLEYVNRESLFFSHIIYGCNTMMNKTAFFSVPLIDMIQEWVGILSHDNLYAKFSGMLGKVIFYPETTMGYRRHGENVTSKQQYGFGIKRIVNRLLDFKELAKDHALTYNQSLIAIRMISEKKKTIELNDLENSIKNGKLKALKYVREKNVNWGNWIKTLSRKLVLLSGTYKRYLINI